MKLLYPLPSGQPDAYQPPRLQRHLVSTCLSGRRGTLFLFFFTVADSRLFQHIFSDVGERHEPLFSAACSSQFHHAMPPRKLKTAADKEATAKALLAIRGVTTESLAASRDGLDGQVHKAPISKPTQKMHESYIESLVTYMRFIQLEPTPRDEIKAAYFSSNAHIRLNLGKSFRLSPSSHGTRV